jgi:hypothetical protein
VDASFSSFLRAEEKDKTLMAHPKGGSFVSHTKTHNVVRFLHLIVYIPL